MTTKAPANTYFPKKFDLKTREEVKYNAQLDPQAALQRASSSSSNFKEPDDLKTKVVKADFSPADFDKNDYPNFHIAFINAAPNLRATKYQKPKGIWPRPRWLLVRLSPLSLAHLQRSPVP